MLREPLALPLRDARSPLVLAIDIGTSGLRVFLFDARARPIARCIAHADRPLRISADGEATVDADERVRAACATIDTVLASAGRRAGEIAVVAVSTFERRQRARLGGTRVPAGRRRARSPRRTGGRAARRASAPRR